MAAPRRTKLFRQFVEDCGSDLVQVVAEGDAWPARVNVKMPDGLQPVDVYISTIGPHARRDYEVRFQNPADKAKRPIVPRGGVHTLLIGFTYADDRPVCVAADAKRRYHSDHRFSVLFHTHIVEQAAQNGWAEYWSSTDERIVAFRPELLPAYLQVQDLAVDVSETSIINAVHDSGVRADATGEEFERARTAVSRLVREAKFRERVMEAYGGRCALSGLNWGLVQAAHIYPVSAPASTDAVINGIALSPTHHILFDQHKVYIDPATWKVQLHPSLYEDTSSAGQQFLRSTLEVMRVPDREEVRPDVRLLEKRYNWFGDAYSWVA